MNQFETKVIAHKSNYLRDEIELAIVKFDHPARKLFVGELVLKEYPEGCAPSPTFVMSNHQAQLLMDNLWDCGIRPSEGTGSAGALAATQKHLADLKTITFHALKIQSPNEKV